MRAGWHGEGADAVAGRAFASGLASIQRIKRAGGNAPGAKYRVVMFHAYPQELLRGWLRQHAIADDQVTAQALDPRARRAWPQDAASLLLPLHAIPWQAVQWCAVAAERCSGLGRAAAFVCWLRS